MAYEFTKLSEVLDAETVSDECNVIVEDGGEIKKTAKSNIGKAQVQADWNQTDPTQPDYIKNKLSCDVPYQQLVTDGEGNVKWEDRLAYDNTKTEFVGAQYSINLDPTSGTVMSQDTIPMKLGQTYAVKVARNDGQGTKEYTGLDVVADDDGTLYIGSSDFESGIYPFRITESSTTVVTAFVKGGGYNYITATCTSNGKIKTIDPKYIKDMYYTQTIPGSDGPIITFQAYLNTISPLTLSEPLIVDAPYMVNVGNDKYKTTCTTDGDHLYITVPAQGTLVVDDPINNPLVALWNGAVTHKNIEIVLESQEEVKQIDPKFIPSKETYFVSSGLYFRTGNDWNAGEDTTIADIVTAYHDGGARIFQMSSGECIGISNVIGASASGSSSPFITYYDYFEEAVSTKS